MIKIEKSVIEHYKEDNEIEVSKYVFKVFGLRFLSFTKEKIVIDEREEEKGIGF